ncbi:hypothetical protein MNEG_3136, partial [Monoraphidium neglectum]
MEPAATDNDIETANVTEPNSSAEQRRQWIDGLCASSSSSSRRRGRAVLRSLSTRWRRFKK